MIRLLSSGLALLLASCGLVEGDEELPEGDGSFEFLPGEEAHEANAPKRVGECRLSLRSEGRGEVVWSYAGPELQRQLLRSAGAVIVAVDTCQNAFIGTTAADGNGHVSKHYPNGELAWDVEFPFSWGLYTMAVSPEGWVVASGEGGSFYVVDSLGRHEKLELELYPFWIQPWGRSWFAANQFFDMAKFSLPSGEISAGGLHPGGGPPRFDALLVGDEALTLNLWRETGEVRLYRTRIRPHSVELDEPWPDPTELAVLPAGDPEFGEIFSNGTETWLSVTDARRLVDTLEDCSAEIHRVEPTAAVWAGDCFVAGALFLRGDNLIAIGVSDVGATDGYALTQLVLDAEGREVSRHIWEDVPLLAGEDPAVARYEDGSVVVAGRTEGGSWVGRVTLWE